MNTEKIDKKSNLLTSVEQDRRRMLLKGLGKGSAVLAATIPLQTLAAESVFTYNGPGTATQIRCGVSGMTSGVHSRDVTTNQCMGYSPGWWGQSSDNGTTPRRTWPNSSTNPKLYNELYNVKFSREALTLEGSGIPTLFQLMNLSRFSNTETRHWVCAYLNAMGYARLSWNFPYSGPEILNFYNDVGPYPRAQAYTFLTTYMEKHSGGE